MFFHPEQLIIPMLPFEDSWASMEVQYSSTSHKIEFQGPEPESGFQKVWDSPSVWVVLTLSLGAAYYLYRSETKEGEAIQRFGLSEQSPSSEIVNKITNFDEERREQQNREMKGRQLLKKHGLPTF